MKWKSIQAGTRAGHRIGRPLLKKGRTPPAGSESVTHWDVVGGAVNCLNLGNLHEIFSFH